MVSSNTALMERRRAFRRPKTKEEIIRGRNIIYVDAFEDIVPALEARKEDEAVIVRPSASIIPVDKDGTPLYYSAQNFSKIGSLVKLQTFNRQEAIANRWSPIKARIEANDRIRNSPSLRNKRWVGWYWFDPEGISHIVRPSVVIEGRRIEMYGHLTGDEEDQVKLVKHYKAKHSHLISIWTKVPSRTSNEKHNVVLHGLTSLMDESRHFEWPRFWAQHSCDFQEGNFSFRFRRANSYCPHEVAAHAAYSKAVAEQSRKIVLQPFPLMTEPALRLYLSAMYDTAVQVPSVGKRVRTRSTTFPQIDALLMNAWVRYGNHDTFWVSSPTKGHKRMSEYNWQNSAAGLPFQKTD